MHHIIFTTAPDLEVARRLARDVIENRLAACANLVPGVESHYRWEGKVCKESEVLMVLKTTGEQLPALEAFVLAEHPYDTPEFVAQTIEAGSARYLDWISRCVGPEGNL
ncbi:MAG: divalent-cation tolerance protein CutA [Verrucomicrobia subdivision 3 bacterium]|nr:divalent-cation tolerance protein CutA [Limisphaerales bacterium]